MLTGWKSSATARKTTDAALSAKTSETPDQAMTRPASAGPADRARLTLTISSLVAARSSDLGTSSGMTDCQVGSCTAVPAASAQVKLSRSAGGICPATVRTTSRIPMTKK